MSNVPENKELSPEQGINRNEFLKNSDWVLEQRELLP